MSFDPTSLSIGQGYDVHPFADGRLLFLGGVQIPCDRGLLGHSDADVLLHAICDALLGAAGLGDIGHFFPNTDDRWKGVSSRVLLRHVAVTLSGQNWKIINIDSSLIAERPRIAAHIPAMKAAIGADLALAEGRIGIKATTNEKLGFVGRGEGIAALATALLVKAV